MSREQLAALVDGGALVLGLALIGAGLALVSVPTALTVVGALLVALVVLERLIQLRR